MGLGLGLRLGLGLGTRIDIRIMNWIIIRIGIGIGIRGEGGGDFRAVTELSFGHITTKTWGYSVVFGFFNKQKMATKKNSPHPSIFRFF